MGVRGLLSHCLERSEQCVHNVDLIQIAHERGGIEILCDYYSFQQSVIEKFWCCLVKSSKNEYVRILGGEYATLETFLTKFISTLKSLSIHLVMFIDGARGSSKIGMEQKIRTWRARQEKETRKLYEIMQVCRGVRRIEHIPDARNIRPVVLEVQFIETLRKCRCEIIQCISGEADYVLAEHLQTRPKAYAILSNDSDFCIFQNSQFIPDRLFDLENDLHVELNAAVAKKPSQLWCGVITSERVCKMLRFIDHTELVELSIIAGNDFTGPLLDHLGIYSLIDMEKRRRISEFSKWVIRHRCMENHPAVYNSMRKNRALKESVWRSRQFYSLTFDPDECAEQSSELTDFLKERIQHLEVPGHVYSMHQYSYWRRTVIEDIQDGAVSIEEVLTPLRKLIYRMVVDRNASYQPVIEHGRSAQGDLQCSVVHPSRAVWVPAANMIDPGDIEGNMRLFSRIMSHMEPDADFGFFDRYGVRDGFICYILRYFLKLNSGRYLHVTRDDIRTLVAAIFAKVETGWYQKLRLRPSVRCVTVFSWFQDIYRYAYDYIGKLLYLSDRFPSPCEIFSGAVFTGFYEIRNPQENLDAAKLRQLSARILMDYLQTVHPREGMIAEILMDVEDHRPRCDHWHQA